MVYLKPRKIGELDVSLEIYRKEQQRKENRVDIFRQNEMFSIEHQSIVRTQSDNCYKNLQKRSYQTTNIA
jgi:hypothetical protein